MKHVIRAVIGLAFGAPLVWLVYQRPEDGYGRWGEAGLYVLAAITAALALLVSEMLLVVVRREMGKLP